MHIKIHPKIFCFCLLLFVSIPECKPQSNSTTVAANTDIGPCTCNLITNICDINCCCDSDCTNSDRQAFSTCVDNYNFSDSQSCFPTALFFRNKTPFKVNQASGNLFCIYNDNFQSRNYYTVPVLLQTADDVDKIYKAYPGFYFPQSIYGNWFTWTNQFSDYYKINDPIFIYFPSNTIGKLSLPYGQSAGSCDFDNPVRFLVPGSAICVRSVGTLNDTCVSSQAWKVSNFVEGFRVAFNPSLFKTVITRTDFATNFTLSLRYNDTSLIPITVSTTCEDSSGNTIVCETSSTTPNFNDTTSECENVLKSLKYDVKYSGTNGIKTIVAEVVLTSLATSATSFQQSFAIVFSPDGKTPGIVRSGNPGYIVGRPVMAGKLNTTSSTQAILVSSDPNQWLNVPSGGDCSKSTRSPVEFGMSTSSGCTLTIQSPVTDRCVEYQRTIINGLLGSSPPNRIATFGNSSPEKPGDWVPILGLGTSITPTTGAGICNQMITGASLSIVYARAGSLANPQNKIIGAQVKFTTGSIKYACSEFNCLPGATAATQTVPITMEVNFIDDSKSPVAMEKAKPVFLARLPYDFFYPFYVENIAQRQQMSAFLFSIPLAAALFHMCHFGF